MFQFRTEEARFDVVAGQRRLSNLGDLKSTRDMRDLPLCGWSIAIFLTRDTGPSAGAGGAFLGFRRCRGIAIADFC